MGKLGGVELNYSSDIDLILLYDTDGMTDGPRPQTNAEFFDAVARELVRLLTEPTELGYAYRVDLRLRPEGEQGPKVHSLEQALHYYDSRGRTWERQAYVKARPVAGDLNFGREFLERLEPWIYRRYLGLADITGIKALKRRIEQRTIREGSDAQRQDRTRRHSRYRIRHPVLAVAQRLRSAGGPHRQYSLGHCPVGSGGLPDAARARLAGGELQFFAEGRAPLANHVRFADPRTARVAQRVAQSRHSLRVSRSDVGAGVGGLSTRLPAGDAREPADSRPFAARRV